MTQDTLVVRIFKYMAVINEVYDEYTKSHGFPSGKCEAEFGRRYVKILLDRHVHTFIDTNNGDILKAATYKAPAKNGVRGNIYAEDLGRSVIDHYGAKYLK